MNVLWNLCRRRLEDGPGQSQDEQGRAATAIASDTDDAAGDEPAF